CVTVGRPSPSRTWKRTMSRSRSLGIQPWTVMVEGKRTIPENRHVMRLTDRAVAPAAFARTADTASASVAVPWRMMSGSPAACATARSVWIGFQIRAHSEYTCANVEAIGTVVDQSGDGGTVTPPRGLLLETGS